MIYTNNAQKHAGESILDVIRIATWLYEMQCNIDHAEPVNSICPLATLTQKPENVWLDMVQTM